MGERGRCSHGGAYAGAFRLLESAGREADSEQTENDNRGDSNSARAAAAAAAVALALLSDKRKNMFVSYAAIEAMIALSREKQLVPEVKYIGACAVGAVCNCSWRDAH